MEDQSKSPLDTDADDGVKSIHNIDQQPAAQVWFKADVHPDSRKNGRNPESRRVGKRLNGIVLGAHKGRMRRATRDA